MLFQSPLWQRLTRPSWHAAILALSTLLYLALGAYSARTERPGVDEGLFADPAYNLLHKGYMGSALPADTHNNGINRYTYYVHPLFILVAAGWFRIVGFGLLSQRALSLVFGLVGLASWHFFVRRLTGDRNVAVLTFALIATDYYYLVAASSGRVDMMAAALGFCSYAVYLWLNERNLMLAILLSQSCAMLSGLTHPMGVLHFAALLYLTVSLDRPRLTLRHLAAGALPYLVGAAAWGIYIAQNPAQFWAQYQYAAQDEDRFRAFREPWRVIWFELQSYGRTFGFYGHTSGHSGPIVLKGLIPMGYLAGLVGVTVTARLRRQHATKILLGMFGVQFLLFTFLNGGRTMLYMVHLLTMYLTFLSVCGVAMWSRRTVAALSLFAAIAALPLLGSGGIAFRAYQDNNRRVFRPAVDFVKARMLPGQTVCATQAYGFEFGFSTETLLNDSSLQRRSGRTPDFLIVDQEEQAGWDLVRRQDPVMWAHMDAALKQYQKVFDGNGIAVYAKP